MFSFRSLFAAAAMILASGGAQATTLSFEIPFNINSNPTFEGGGSANGTPMVVTMDYDDTGLIDASFTLNGFTGTFESVSLTTTSSNVRGLSGLQLSFTIDSVRPGSNGYS